jgi:hypothetical protein
MTAAAQSLFRQQQQQLLPLLLQHLLWQQLALGCFCCQPHDLHCNCSCCQCCIPCCLSCLLRLALLLLLWV